MAFVETILLILVVLFCFYKWSTSTYDFFEKRNIPFEKPIPMLGNFQGMFLKTESMYDAMKRFHSKFNSKVYGLFEMRNPLIVIKDIDLIKQITVKDFDHFMNHRAFIGPEDDALFGNSLFTMQDQKWKDMRATLSPAFTGSKMRLMFQLIGECCEEALQNLKSKATADKNNSVVIETKDFFTHYTNDVIASTAFGLKINSMADEDNEFYRMGRKVTNFSTWIMVKFSLFSNLGPVMRFLRVQLFDTKFTSYFLRLVTDSMKYRSAHNIVRPDMINMLMEAQKTNEKTNGREWSEYEIVAQCFLFFIAGFETTSILMSFAAQELMENPDIQEKLLSEINEVNESLNGEPLTYEALQGMKYMDMVISETLRKWPPALATDRVCSKPYVLKTDENTIDVRPGDVLWIPITGLHYDPENFPDPEKFDPERFSDENKANIKPFSYSPFGLGPRNCIGSRLALMEAKAILYHMLRDFSFEASEKTSIPIQLAPVGFQLKPKNGFWLKLVPRK